ASVTRTSAPVWMSPASEPVMIRPGKGRTIVVSVAVLLAGLASGVAPWTVAGLVGVPVADGEAAIVRVAQGPEASGPTIQVRTPRARETAPRPGVAETKLALAGSTSLRLTP